MENISIFDTRPSIPFVLALLLSISFTTRIRAQETPAEVRALKYQIDTSKTDYDRVTRMMKLAYHYTNNFHPDSAIVYILRSKETFNKETYIDADSSRNVKRERWIISELVRAYMLKMDEDKLTEAISELVGAAKQNPERLQDHYYIIGYYYMRWYRNHEEGLKRAIHYLDISEQLAYKLNKHRPYILAQFEKISCYQNLGKVDTVEVLIDQLQAFEKKYYDSLSARTYLTRYTNKVIKGQYNLALENLLTALSLTEKYQDDLATSSIYSYLGSIHEELNRPEESIKWHKKSLEFVQEIKKRKPYTFTTNGHSIHFMETCALVEQLLKLDRGDEAHDLIEKAITTYPPTSEVQKARAAQMKAYYYDAIGDKQLAYKNYIEMAHYYDMVHRMEMPGSFEKAMNDMSSFLIRENKFEEARKFILKAIAGKVSRPHPIHVSRSYKLLYKTDSAQGDYLSSLANLLQHKRIQDSIFNERKAYQMEELQVKYAVSEKEKDIQVLKSTEQLRAAALQQAEVVQKFTFSGIVILGFLLFLSYNQVRLKRRTNLQLESQQKEIEGQNVKLKHLVDEKEWLLKEVHHRVKNNLHMITSLLSSQAFQLKDEMAKLAVRDSQNRIQAMSMVHHKLYTHDNISTVDSSTYIGDLVEYLKDSFATDHIHFTTTVDSIKLDSQRAIPIGLILNEAVTNSIKYAFPERQCGVIQISFQRTNESFLLKISDNGIGFSPELQEAKPKSLGMTLINGLAQELGAVIEVKSDHGTSITLTIPKDEV